MTYDNITSPTSIAFHPFTYWFQKKMHLFLVGTLRRMH